MGYTSYVTGRYRIEPELPGQVISSLSLGEDGESDLIAKSGGTPDTVGLVDGEIAVIPGDSWTEVECRYDERYKAYDLDERVRDLVDAAKRAGCTVSGALYLDGEDTLDFSRIRVENNVVQHESPELVWPNGEKGWT